MDKQTLSSGTISCLLALLAIPLLLLSINAGGDLVSAGEARAAQIAREMVERGNLILPSLNHVVSGESMTKPPLFHWSIIASAAVLGWDNVAVKIPVIASSMGALLLVFLLGRMMFGRRGGILSLLVLSSSVLFMSQGGTLRMDIFFAFLILLSLTGFYGALGKPGSRMAYLFYLGAGLAVMTKGPAGAVIPFGVSLGYLWLTGGLHRLPSLRFKSGMALFFLITLPWYLAVGFTAPPELVHHFFFGQLSHWWSGSSGAVKEGGKGVLYYLPYLLLGLFPWSLFLPGAVVAATQGDRATPQGEERPLLLILLWFVGGLVLFSLGGKKASRYLLPMLPAGALLVGYYWTRLAADLSSGHRRGLLAGAAVVVILTLLLLVSLMWGLAHSDAALAMLVRGKNAGEASGLHLLWGFITSHGAWWMLLATLLFSLSIVAGAALQRGLFSRAAALLALMVWILLFAYQFWLQPYKEAYKSPRAAAQWIAPRLPQDAILYGGGRAYKHAMRYYLGHDIRLIHPDALYRRVREEPQTWVLIMTKKAVPDDLFVLRPNFRRWEVDYYSILLFAPMNVSIMEGDGA